VSSFYVDRGLSGDATSSHGTIVVEGAILSGHHEVADVYDAENRPAKLRDAIARFNGRLTAVRSAVCSEWVAEGDPLDGKFAMAG
jgi:hypothetical protein